jgi:hypothetical protein
MNLTTFSTASLSRRAEDISFEIHQEIGGILIPMADFIILQTPLLYAAGRRSTNSK